MLRRFIQDESGATAIEYGLIGVILSLAILVGIGKVTGAIDSVWGDNQGRLQQAID